MSVYNGTNDYTIMLVAGHDETNYCQGECSAYLGGYKTCDRADVPVLSGFFLGLYFKTLERALDEGYAIQVRVADLIAGKYQTAPKTS